MPAPGKINKCLAVTPSDTINILPDSVAAGLCDGFYVGGAGNVTIVNQDNTTCLFTAPPVGSVIMVQFKRINATGTTATAIVALVSV